MTTLKLSEHRAIGSLVRRALPWYRKATVIIDDYHASNVALLGCYWDGGSRNSYSRVSLADGRAEPLYGHSSPPQFSGVTQDKVVELDDKSIIVECGTFCGKPAYAHIFANAKAREALGLPALKSMEPTS
jgi:hypothetical protein